MFYLKKLLKEALIHFTQLYVDFPLPANQKPRLPERRENAQVQSTCRRCDYQFFETDLKLNL